MTNRFTRHVKEKNDEKDKSQSWLFLSVPGCQLDLRGVDLCTDDQWLRRQSQRTTEANHPTRCLQDQ
jgi:hypothetical protein